MGLVAVVVLAATVRFSEGATITFDDLTTRKSFMELGIDGNYQGFEWGFSTSPGLSEAIIPSSSSTLSGSGTGWASASVADPAVYPAPTPVSGDSYAWNWNGPQSLFVNFLSPQDVSGAYFAILSTDFSLNASSVQMFGYDELGNPLSSSSVLNLTDSFQHLAANFSGVTFLEIRSDQNERWFSIDNLEVNGVAVPEPSSIVLMNGLFVLVGIGMYRRRQMWAARYVVPQDR